MIIEDFIPEGSAIQKVVETMKKFGSLPEGTGAHKLEQCSRCNTFVEETLTVGEKNYCEPCYSIKLID